MVLTPECTHSGLGSSDFARRYFRNHCCFLFLRLLRCFSSAGSPCMVMDSPCSTRGLPWWVSPFGYRRISGYVLLPVAFRSLSRPSSAPGARAFALRPFCLTALKIYSVISLSFLVLSKQKILTSSLSSLYPLLPCTYLPVS